MKEGSDLLYPTLVRVRVPREVADALSTASRRKFLTTSEYARQALMRELRTDGIVIEPSHAAA